MAEVDQDSSVHLLEKYGDVEIEHRLCEACKEEKVCVFLEMSFADGEDCIDVSVWICEDCEDNDIAVDLGYALDREASRYDD